MATQELLARLRAYIAQMDSEQRERRSSKLLIMAADEIETLLKKLGEQ